jgi:hypothetical protein
MHLIPVPVGSAAKRPASHVAALLRGLARKGMNSTEISRKIGNTMQHGISRLETHI